jgi:hypothetical protein
MGGAIEDPAIWFATLHLIREYSRVKEFQHPVVI